MEGREEERAQPQGAQEAKAKSGAGAESRRREEWVPRLEELEHDRFLRFQIERHPSSKINSIFPKYIDCTGFFPENELFEPLRVEVRVDYWDEEGGWFWSEDFSVWGWRGCELKRKEGKVLLPLGKLLEDVIWRLTYGNLEGRDPALARRLKRAKRLRLKFGQVTCQWRRGWLKRRKADGSGS